MNTVPITKDIAMILRLLFALITFAFALLGTALGNLMRVFVDSKYRARYVMPDTDDLIITGVLSNGLIATLIAALTGRRRLWCAVVSGAVLTLFLGDRLDQNLSLSSGQNGRPAEPKTVSPETVPTNGVNPAESNN